MKWNLRKMLSMAVTFTMLFSSTSSFPVHAVTSTANYVKYDCSTGTTTNYSLSLSDYTTTQSRGLVGTDDQAQSGNDGIVKLVVNGVWKGTGFIVGNHQIATAAHCVYKDGTNGASDYFLEDLEVQLYDDDGNPTNEVLEVQEIHVSSAYISQYSEKEDFALLTVTEDLSAYTQFDLGVAYDPNTTAFSKVPLFVSGIRLVDGNYGVYTGMGYESPIATSDETILCYTCDTLGGQSGSPVYTATLCTVGNSTTVTYTAIAIHGSAGSSQPETNYYNEGSPITTEKIQFFLSNSYASY